MCNGLYLGYRCLARRPGRGANFPSELKRKIVEPCSSLGERMGMLSMLI